MTLTADGHTASLHDGVAIAATSAHEIADLPAFLADHAEPHVIRGLVGDWPLVKQGQQSNSALGSYLEDFYSGAPLITSVGPPSIRGRIGYNESFTGFNYQRTHMQLADFLARIQQCAGVEESPTLYVGSSMLSHYFPGLDAANPLQLGTDTAISSLWLGNRVVVSAHFDFPHNLACCVAGRRRFTLFPPAQLENLYVGPWDRTPAGQPISLVDLHNPDLERFPRFAKALQASRTTVLEPGDALFLPSMWWHHVEGLDDLNILLNYWWRDTPAYMGSPLTVLKHAMLGIRDLPREQREALRHIFDCYVFGDAEQAVAHIPASSRGVHAPMDEDRARAVRADLLNMLKR